METEIRACPFCGGEAHAALAAYAGGATAHVVCDACGAKVYGYGLGERGLSDAMESWNRRAERTCVFRYEEKLGEYACSSCGELVSGTDPDAEYEVSVLAALESFEYCPHCGARVIEEES